MDFSSVNNMNSYLKSIKMENNWKKNKNNCIKSGIPGDPNDMETNKSSFGDDRFSSIMTKVQSGQELTADDIEYLRNNYPEVYEDIMKTEKEKKLYEQALRRCKTKEDARMLQMGKVSEALISLKSGVDPRSVAAKLIKMTNVYIKFTKTKQYSKMAFNHLELAKMLEAEKEYVSKESKKEEKIEIKEFEKSEETKEFENSEKEEISQSSEDESGDADFIYEDETKYLEENNTKIYDAVKFVEPYISYGMKDADEKIGEIPNLDDKLNRRA